MSAALVNHAGEQTPRFLLYSHDGFGLGHTRRHVAIAAALTAMAPQASVLLASGADDVYRLGLPPRVEAVKLPGLRKVANGEYQSRRLGLPMADIRALRAGLLEAAVKTFRPHVVLVDKHPLGACGEFDGALAALRQSGGRAALGLRDILDETPVVLAEWTSGHVRECIDTCYDLVLVYGERAVFDPVTAYEFLPGMAKRTRFCGYILNQAKPSASVSSVTQLEPAASARPCVVATAGGGEDGFVLLDTFVRAAEGAPWRGLAVAGPMLSEPEWEKLRDRAERAGVEIHAFVPDLPSLFSAATALVSMGGYNTLVEAVASGVPIVCVPRMSPRREQEVRATAFEGLGLLRTLRADELSVERLRKAIAGAMHVPRREVSGRRLGALSFDGARCAAAHLLALARGPRGAQLPVPWVARSC
jgi:predicted glycosyltransferase